MKKLLFTACSLLVIFLLLFAIWFFAFNGRIDLENLIAWVKQYTTNQSTLTLSPERQLELQENGTWADLFPSSLIQNRSQFVAVILWWFFLQFLGWITYPIIQSVMPGLRDSGYPLSRLTGLLLLAYPTWLLGSLGVPITRLTITLILGILILASITVILRQRHRLLDELRQRKRYILGVELIASVSFCAFLLIRLGNPDLWHIYFGGEKPMDFSYFNAVLKSITFPPYDPWFAGGVLNYYYYGFVIVGIPVKLLSIDPSVAYNLILPSVFSLVILGAFSIGWNLSRKLHWVGGVFGAFAVAILGNSGTVRMIWDGWQRLAAPEEVIRSANLVQHIQYALSGVLHWITGEGLPYSIGDWYWIPSRAVIPAYNSEITEFPFFSFIYADLHAHLIALPITLLVIAWSLSVILTNAQWGNVKRSLWGLAFGAMVVGSLRAANSWDHPTYLILSSLALVYALINYLRALQTKPNRLIFAWALIELALFIGLSFIFFTPFNNSFRQGYTQVLPWQGDHVNLTSYLIHWGLFLFVLTAWLFEECINWMAQTPLSALNRLRPHKMALLYLVLFLAVSVVWLIGMGIFIAILVAPLGIMCAILLFRKNQPGSNRFVLFLAGTGLALTLAVELIALQGDRMNTIFKFYFQAWTFLSISSAASLACLLPKLKGWNPKVHAVFNIILVSLIASCALTSLMSTKSKIIDRMAENAPHTLDGMAFLDYASMIDGIPGSEGQKIILADDARAIRWMRENVKGSPVIVEAHTGEYRHWGTRYTIYTGLPGIIGWEAHQRQQRATMTGDPVSERIQQVNNFYLTTDRSQVIAFINQYRVKYVILGQLERAYYGGKGLEKFNAYQGDLWNLVYSDGSTEIYEVFSHELSH